MTLARVPCLLLRGRKTPSSRRDRKTEPLPWAPDAIYRSQVEKRGGEPVKYDQQCHFRLQRQQNKSALLIVVQ